MTNGNITYINKLFVKKNKCFANLMTNLQAFLASLVHLLALEDQYSPKKKTCGTDSSSNTRGKLI